MTWRAMSGTGSSPSGRSGPRDGETTGQPVGRSRLVNQGKSEENSGWTIFSYLIAGMVAYGLLGWLVAWLAHIPVLFPVGALVGLLFAVAGVVWKYGRH